METNFKYAQILINLPKLDTRTFSYLIPEDLKSEIKIGQAVSVPFGMQGAVNGFVVGFSNYLPEHIKAKSVYEILETEPLFTLEYLQFLEWIAQYYCVNLQSVIETAIPMSLIAKTKKVITLKKQDFTLGLDKELQKIINILAEKTQMAQSSLMKASKMPSGKFYSGLRKLKNLDMVEVKDVIQDKTQKTQTEKYVKYLNSKNVTSRQKTVLDLLENQPEIKMSEFVALAKTTFVTVKKLAENNNVEIFEKELYRNPLSVFENEKQEKFPSLNDEQQFAYQKISELMHKQDYSPVLLYGVTGSGKTEVYFKLIDDVLKLNKTVIFLAPEIAVASQLARRFVRRFGLDEIALWHSSVSEGEKFDIMQRLKENKVKIIIGARSAVFAPIKNLGLIIIDEEHEAAYKQTSPSPRYDARTLAQERAKREQAHLLLGSATPDINTYYQAVNSNRIVTIKERFGNSKLADVKIIDMKQEVFRGNRSIFSKILRSAIQKNLDDKKQTLLLINRRGFSTSVFCQACGHIVECKKCAIPLILHKTTGNLRCHYCNYETSMIEKCPECGSDAIRSHGLGTQKVEEFVRKDFPIARIARMDSDIMAKKNAHIELLNEFQNGEIDILIGTQMIAKGLDNPNVTLVGVLMADQSFSIPDFRGSERGFQLLTQVAGRAGRGDTQGRVYFQTFTPEFFALETAKKQDYKNFYLQEIENRYELAYPPYSKIIRLVLSSSKEFRTEKMAQELAMRLKELVENQGIQERLEVLGPSSCVIPRIKNEYRYQILIKNRLEEKGHFLITNYLKKVNIPEDIKLITDIDPTDML